MSKRHQKDPAGRETRLFLEKTPAPDTQREFDEIVPEFMHRAFYRSTEDEIQVVEPGRLRPSKKPEKAAVVEELAPLRNSGPASTRPPAPEPLTPLRSGRDEERDYFEPEPLLSAPAAESFDTPVPLKKAPESEKGGGSSINVPLLTLLLFIVGLFSWRELTRPRIPETAELPIPSAVTVAGEKADNVPAQLEEESPYPEMSPGGMEGVASDSPAVKESDTTITMPRETEEDADPIPPAGSEQETAAQPTEDEAAQRAALLDRVNQATGRDTASTEEEVPLPPPPQNSSLFPSETATRPPAPRPAPVAAQPKPAAPMNRPAAQPSRPANQDSLFPGQSAAAVTSPAPKPVAAPPKPVTAQPKPVLTQPKPAPARPKPAPAAVNSAPAKPVQGEQYEIAEPTF